MTSLVNSLQFQLQVRRALRLLGRLSGWDIVTALGTTVSDILTDLQRISNKVTIVDTAVTAFPLTGGSVVNALNIHLDMVDLGRAIDEAASDVNQVAPKPFSEADGTTILSSVQSYKPTALHALNQFIVKKPAFVGLQVGGFIALITQDLNSLENSCIALQSGLVGSVPSDLVSTATAIRADFAAGFESTIADYP
ncbi:hydrophobic surface binding protein A-domain-containing protein [Flammula alnicola]|nr:hydrophobic surface binding protein A-domain-containing protein [Flammula alnicola]